MPLYNLQSINDLPTSFTHWHDESILVAGTAIGRYYGSGYPYFADAEQFPAANGDSFKFSKLLAAGNYKLFTLGLSSNQQGILALSINGVQAFNNLDRYSVSVSATALEKDITIATDGMQEFIFSIVGKTGAGFSASITKFWAYKI